MKTEEKKVATEKGMDLLSLIFGYPSHEQCVINHKKAMGKCVINHKKAMGK